MRMEKMSYRKMAGILALLISIFSIGAFLAVQCHSEEPSHSIAAGSHHGDGEKVGFASDSNVIKEVCAGFTIFFLLALRKFYSGNSTIETNRRGVSKFHLLKISEVQQYFSHTTSSFHLGALRI